MTPALAAVSLSSPALSNERTVATTVAPALARAMAVCSPMPLEVPVMSAIFVMTPLCARLLNTSESVE